MSDTFTCVVCGGTFEKGCTDEEAPAEREKVYWVEDPDGWAMVCEDCYNPGMQIIVAG